MVSSKKYIFPSSTSMCLIKWKRIIVCMLKIIVFNPFTMVGLMEKRFLDQLIEFGSSIHLYPCLSISVLSKRIENTKITKMIDIQPDPSQKTLYKKPMFSILNQYMKSKSNWITKPWINIRII